MTRSGESQAESFDRGVASHIGLVRHIGAASLSGQYDLDDFTQDVLARVFAKRDQLRDLSRLRAWMATIARNTAQNWNRKQQFMFAELSDALSLPPPPADEWLSQRERWAALVDALSRLPESDQALIRAYYYDELSARELQAQTRLSAAVIRVRLSRARAVLRERLMPLLGALGVMDRVRAPRRFGEVPRGDNRMGMSGSFACSLAVIGWLGFGASQVEEAAWNVTASTAQAETLAPIEAPAARPRPTVELMAAAGAGEGAADEERSMGKVLDIGPTPDVSTLVGGVHAMLQAAGHSEWSTARLQGVLGHAFSFVMNEGAGKVEHVAGLDWGTPPKLLPLLGYQVQVFEAYPVARDSPLKGEAWEAVRASIDRGIPAVAWQPMSLDQQASGVTAYVWGLLVGYDESEGTYAVRHQYVNDGSETFTVRYDAIGHTDPPWEWFCVMVYDEPLPADLTTTHRTALENVAGFANGTRWFRDTRPDGVGYAAYELWRDAFASGEASPLHSGIHSEMLMTFRRHAADYLREVVAIFPHAAHALKQAAALYDQEVQTLGKLHDLCTKAEDTVGFSDVDRIEAAGLVTAALAADRDAVTTIEAAIAGWRESQ